MLMGIPQSEKNNYAQCPSCEEIRRVNEFKIIRDEVFPKAILDNLLQVELEFEEKKKKIIYDATKNSNRNVNKNLFESNPITKIQYGHDLRDHHFFEGPIDYISFDGYFTVRRLNNSSFVEIKTGDTPLLSREEK